MLNIIIKNGACLINSELKELDIRVKKEKIKKIEIITETDK